MQNPLYKITILLSLLLWGCSREPIPHQVKPCSVKMAYSRSKDVFLHIATTGHIEAYNSVQILAQIDGRLIKTYFLDGTDVKRGDPLYLIEQRPYLANVKKAEGQLEESFATLGLSERVAERHATLVEEEYISHNDYDNLTTTVLINDAIVKQRRADLENAQINLEHTIIYAPCDGRVGESQVHSGNFIIKNATKTLVTLNQITPIYVTFYINEKELPQVQHYKNMYKNLKTQITIDDSLPSPYEGTLTFIDNAVDLSTGMIKLKAILSNEDKMLWANQYVKVKLILDTLENSVVIPVECVQNSTAGKYVYVINENQTVESRNVKVGQIQEDNTIMITEGIKAGERVVTEGQMKLYSGAKVKIIPNEHAMQ